MVEGSVPAIRWWDRVLLRIFGRCKIKRRERGGGALSTRKNYKAIKLEEKWTVRGHSFGWKPIIAFDMKRSSDQYPYRSFPQMIQARKQQETAATTLLATCSDQKVIPMDHFKLQVYKSSKSNLNLQHWLHIAQDPAKFAGV